MRQGEILRTTSDQVFNNNSSYNETTEFSINRIANAENLHKVSVVVFTIVSLFIISTNSFVVAFLYGIKDNKLRDRISMILALSFCDITLGIGGLLLSITRIFNFCQRLYASVTFIFIEVGVISSVCQTLIICVERFLAVTTTTIRKKIFGRRRRYIITFSVLIFLFIASACAKMFMTDEINICTLAGIYGENYYPIIRVFFFGLYIPPLTAIIIFYQCTMYNIKVHSRRIGAVIDSQEDGSYLKSENPISKQRSNQTDVFTCRSKMAILSSRISSSENTTKTEPITGLTKMRSTTETIKKRSRGRNNHADKSVTTMKAIRLLSIIILTMVLTTGAGSILFATEALCTYCDIPMNLRVLVTSFWFLNSAMNPIIYTFGIKEFRLSIAKTFRCNSSRVIVV